MIRIATYNVHKCRGFDRRVSVARIADVVAQLKADIVAVQELLHDDDEAGSALDQAGFLAKALGYRFAFGENRRHRGAAYGNATFSRFPITLH